MGFGSVNMPTQPSQTKYVMLPLFWPTLRWRHNVHDGVSNHQPHDCLFNRLFRRRSKKTSKLRVTGVCVGNSPGTGEFPAQMASNAENVSIWWRHHEGCRWHSVLCKSGKWALWVHKVAKSCQSIAQKILKITLTDAATIWLPFCSGIVKFNQFYENCWFLFHSQ